MSVQTDSPTLALAEADLRAVERFRAGQPYDRITLMFSDLVQDGESALSEEVSVTYRITRLEKLQQDHARAVREAVEHDDGGLVVTEVYGSSLVAFADAGVAVARALRIQREIARQNEGRPAPDLIQARIGIDAGPVGDDGDRYAEELGRIAYRAGVLTDAAVPGQILLTGAVRRVTPEDAGTARLHPVTWEIAAESLAEAGGQVWAVANDSLPVRRPLRGHPPGARAGATAGGRTRKAGRGTVEADQGARRWLKDLLWAGGAALAVTILLGALMLGRPPEATQPPRRPDLPQQTLVAAARALAPRETEDAFARVSDEGRAQLVGLVEANPERLNPSGSRLRIDLAATTRGTAASVTIRVRNRCQLRAFHIDRNGEPALLLRLPAVVSGGEEVTVPWQAPPAPATELLLVVASPTDQDPFAAEQRSYFTPLVARINDLLDGAPATRPRFTLALATLRHEPEGQVRVQLVGEE